MDVIDNELLQWALRNGITEVKEAMAGAQSLLDKERQSRRYFVFKPGEIEGCGVVGAVYTKTEANSSIVLLAVKKSIQASILTQDGTFRALTITLPSKEEEIDEKRVLELLKEAVRKGRATGFKNEESGFEKYSLLLNRIAPPAATQLSFSWSVPEKSFGASSVQQLVEGMDFGFFGKNEKPVPPAVKKTITGKAHFFNHASFSHLQHWQETATEAAEKPLGAYYIDYLGSLKNKKALKPAWADKLDILTLKDMIFSLRRAERKRLRTAQMQFMSYMDQEILLFMRDSGILQPNVYSWLQAEGDATKRRNRFQAVRSYPILTLNFVTDEKLTTAIDAGQELRPLLLEALGSKEYGPIKKSTLQRLAALPRALYVPRLPNKITYLDALPPDWWPKSKPQWKALNKIITYAETFAKYMCVKPEDVVKEAKGDWVLYADRLEKLGHPTGLKDFMERFKKILIGPALVAAADAAGKNVNWKWLSFHQSIKVGEREKRLAALPFAGESLQKMLLASKEWHDRLQTFNTRIQSIALMDPVTKQGSEAAREEWVALSERTIAPNGLVIQPLTTKTQLQETGKDMKHCVGGYTSSCMLHSSHILDILDADGKRLSTVELRETGDEKKPLLIAQNYTTRNFSASEEARETAQWYVAQIAEGQIKPGWDAIKARREEARDGYAKLQMFKDIGFDPRNINIADAAFDVCRQFLPRSQQSMTRTEWLEKTGVTHAVQKIADGEGTIIEHTPTIQERFAEGFLNAPIFIDEIHEMGHVNVAMRNLLIPPLREAEREALRNFEHVPLHALPFPAGNIEPIQQPPAAAQGGGWMEAVRRIIDDRPLPVHEFLGHPEGFQGPPAPAQAGLRERFARGIRLLRHGPAEINREQAVNNPAPPGQPGR